MAEPGLSPPGPRFKVTCGDTEDALHTPPRVVQQCLGIPQDTYAQVPHPGKQQRYGGGGLFIESWGEGGIFAADALKRRSGPCHGSGSVWTLVQAVLGAEQPGKKWGSSFSILTPGLSERGKRLRKERKRSLAEGRGPVGSWRLPEGKELREVVLREGRATDEWSGVRRGDGGSVGGSEFREDEAVREEREAHESVGGPEEPMTGRDHYQQ